MKDFTLLTIRVWVGLMMMLGHGWGKLASYSTRLDTFSDPLGLGPAVSLTLAVFAEFFCSLFLVLGLGTRLATVPLIITMAVAGLVVHFDDPFKKKELALLYLVPYLTLLFLGGGKYSLQHLLTRRLNVDNKVVRWLIEKQT